MNEAVKEIFTMERERQREHPAMMAFTYTGCWGGDASVGWPNGPKCYLIDGFTENVNIVHETPEDGYIFKFITASQSLLDHIERIRNPQ